MEQNRIRWRMLEGKHEAAETVNFICGELERAMRGLDEESDEFQELHGMYAKTYLLDQDFERKYKELCECARRLFPAVEARLAAEEAKRAEEVRAAQGAAPASKRVADYESESDSSEDLLAGEGPADEGPAAQDSPTPRPEFPQPPPASSGLVTPVRGGPVVDPMRTRLLDPPPSASSTPPSSAPSSAPSVVARRRTESVDVGDTWLVTVPPYAGAVLAGENPTAATLAQLTERIEFNTELSGATALHVAVMNNRADLLLAWGAREMDPTTIPADDRGYSPAGLAVAKKRWELLRLLPLDQDALSAEDVAASAPAAVVADVGRRLNLVLQLAVWNNRVDVANVHEAERPFRQVRSLEMFRLLSQRATTRVDPDHRLVDDLSDSLNDILIERRYLYHEDDWTPLVEGLLDLGATPSNEAVMDMPHYTTRELRLRLVDAVGADLELWTIRNKKGTLDEHADWIVERVQSGTITLSQKDLFHLLSEPHPTILDAFLKDEFVNPFIVGWLREFPVRVATGAATILRQHGVVFQESD